MKNIFLDILDIKAAKAAISKEMDKVGKGLEANLVILIPQYSINIQAKYAEAEDPEQIYWDWQDLEDKLGWFMEVSQYDDLVINVN